MTKTNLVYAALLLNSAGKEISEENVKKVASAVGEVEDASIKALVSALEGVNISDVISKAAMPVAMAAPAAAQPVAEKQAEPEEDVAKKAEAAAEGLGSLFG